MSQGSMPFFDSAEEATRHAIHESGRPIKDVAAALWPEKSTAAAQTLLLNALNPGRTERLTADQHIFIANYTGCFDFLYYACMACNHKQPEVQTPEELKAEVMGDMSAMVADMRTIMTRYDSLQARLQGHMESKPTVYPFRDRRKAAG